MRKKTKLIWGVGINDADYPVERFKDGKMVWICPYYHKWRKMLERCYSDKWRALRPSYKDVTVVEEWLLFSTFKQWMVEQDQPLDYQLDKDILVPGNNVYGPDTCLLVPKHINNLFVNVASHARRGKYPAGVNKVNNKYKAQISKSGKMTHIGYYFTPEEAHVAWRKEKTKQIEEYANLYPKLNEAMLYWSNNLEEILK